MNTDTEIICKHCADIFTPKDLIDRIEKYWEEVDVFVSSTPCCNNEEEFRISINTFVRGYVYAAGCPHFSGVEEYELSCEIPERWKRFIGTFN